MLFRCRMNSSEDRAGSKISQGLLACNVLCMAFLRQDSFVQRPRHACHSDNVNQHASCVSIKGWDFGSLYLQLVCRCTLSLAGRACDNAFIASCLTAQVVVIDVRAMGRKGGNQHRKLVVDRALATKDQDNERFYKNLRARFDRRVHTAQVQQLVTRDIDISSGSCYFE